MGRRGKTTTAETAGADQGSAGVGHNQLTDDDKTKLLLRHLQTLEAIDVEKDAAVAVLAGIKKRRTKARNEARGDQFPLKLIDEILADQVRPTHELQDETDQRNWMREVTKLPTRSSEEVFAKMPDAARDELTAEADGWRAGRAGSVRQTPVHVHPINQQTWLKAYDAGAEKRLWAWAKDQVATAATKEKKGAAKAKAEEPKPSPAPAPVVEAKPEAEWPDDVEAEAAKAAAAESPSTLAGTDFVASVN